MASVLPKAAAKQYRSRRERGREGERERERGAGKYKRRIDVYDLRRIERKRERGGEREGEREREDLEYSRAEKGGIAITLFLSLQANTSATSLSLPLFPASTRRICKGSCLPNGNGIAARVCCVAQS